MNVGARNGAHIAFGLRWDPYLCRSALSRSVLASHPRQGPAASPICERRWKRRFREGPPSPPGLTAAQVEADAIPVAVDTIAHPELADGAISRRRPQVAVGPSSTAIAGVKIDANDQRRDDCRNDEPMTVQVSTREAVRVDMKMHGRTPFSGALAIVLIKSFSAVCAVDMPKLAKHHLYWAVHSG